MLLASRRRRKDSTPSLWGTLPADVRRWAAPIVGVEPCVWWQLKWRNPGALLPWTGAGAAPSRTLCDKTGRRCRPGGSHAAAYIPLLGGVRTRLRRVARIPGPAGGFFALSPAVRQSGTFIGKERRAFGQAFPEVGRVAKQPSSKQSKKKKTTTNTYSQNPLPSGRSTSKL